MFKTIQKMLIIVGLFCASVSWADHPTVGVQNGNAAPITTSSAFTLDEGQLIFSIDNQYLDLQPVSKNLLVELGEQGESVHSAEAVNRTSLNLAWGFSERLTFGVSLPYIERHNLTESPHHEELDEDHHDEGSDHEIEHEGAAVEQLGDARGLGDLQLYGQYQFFNSESEKQAAALVFGVKAPTGRTGEKSDKGERLETELQPGSGSWDLFAGIAYSRQISGFSFDSNLLYTSVTEGAQNTDLGDIVNYNLSLAYPLNAGHDDGHSHHQHMKTEVVFELNGEWRDRTTVSGETEINSGGNIIYLSPGVRVSIDNWALSGSIGFPVEHYNGVQSEPEVRAVVRLSRLF